MAEESSVRVGPGTIDARMRQLRRACRPQLTQRELAERAGVSVDLVSKLEQGQKQSALLGSLRKIAAALDVDVGVLLAGPTHPDAADDGRLAA